MSSSSLFGVVFFAVFVAIAYSQISACFFGLCPFGYVCSANCCYLATSCFDNATNCAANVNLCTNVLYRDLMTQRCRRTCGFCGLTSTTCFDRLNANGINECPSLTRLCNNATYYTLMTQQCPLTCGRCTVG